MQNINERIKSLNNNLPELALRRNHAYYEYVCYINNVYTFFVCEQYKEVELFIQRANRFLEANKENHKYFIESKKLIDEVSRLIVKG